MIKNTIGVASGKGGTGKTLVSVNLGLELAKEHRVGILDADVKSPNVSCMLGGDDAQIEIDGFDIIPPIMQGIKVFSTATIFPQGQAIIWKGENIREYLERSVDEVKWGDLDYLVVDFDPSSGDSLIAMKDLFKKIRLILVSTAHKPSLWDCERIMDMCIRKKIKLIGIVGNMVGSECPSCGGTVYCRDCGAEISFGDAQPIREIANRFKVKYLGDIRFNPKIRDLADSGQPALPNRSVIQDIIEELL